MDHGPDGLLLRVPVLLLLLEPCLFSASRSFLGLCLEAFSSARSASMVAWKFIPFASDTEPYYLRSATACRACSAIRSCLTAREAPNAPRETARRAHAQHGAITRHAFSVNVASLLQIRVERLNQGLEPRDVADCVTDEIRRCAVLGFQFMCELVRPRGLRPLPSRPPS